MRSALSRFTKSIPKLTLFLLYLLFFWSDAATYRPGMDSMTYGTLARHMVETGDYITPHYHAQAYADFFQHPPLGLWLMAFTMRAARFLFGLAAYHSELVLKFLPSLFGGICVALVYIWMKRIRDERFAFWAAFVLLTSVRFMKYSNGFMLDPFLATFSLAGLYVATFGYPFLAGLLITAAALSKGLFALAPFAVILVLYRSQPRRLAAFIIAFGLPMLAWLQFGNGFSYFHHYLVEHVQTRIGRYPLIDHLAPLLNLTKVYWPWLPFYAIGLGRIFREKRSVLPELEPEAAIGLTSLAFLGGFMLVASFLEQYNTSFYPFAAFVVAIGLPNGLVRATPSLSKGLLGVLVVLASAMIADPKFLHGREYANPLRNTFREIRPKCPTIRGGRLVVSTEVAEIWYALAMGGWYVDADVYSAPALEGAKKNSADLLVALRKEPKSEEWEETSIGIDPYRVFRRKGTDLCAIMK